MSWRKRFGQTPPGAPMIPGAMPMVPAMPGAPGSMPGMPGLPGTATPAPVSTTPSSPQAPQPDATWLMQMLQTQGGGAAMPLIPGAPGAPGSGSASGNVMQAIVTKYQAGVTAFQQLTTVHTIFRTPIMAPHFMNASDEDNFFYNNSDDLQTLCNLLIPIPVQQVTDMINWLMGVSPGTVSYPPSDWIKLVQKLILGQKVSFPTIELPYRIITFLSKVLISTVTGTQVAQIQAQQDTLRQVLYTKMDTLSQMQADFQLAVEDANVPPDVTDPVGWASNILSQARSPQAQAIITAQGQVEAAKTDLQNTQDQIQSTNEEMAALQTATLTPDELAKFLIANLPASAELDTLTASYQKIQDAISLYNSLTQPILAQQNQMLATMSPFQAALASAQAAFVAARGPINYAAEIHQTPSQDQIDAYNQAQAALTSAQSALQPYQDQMTALGNQMQAVIAAHPEFFVKADDGSSKIITDPDVVSSLINDVLTQAATDMPSDLMSVVQDAMAVDAQAADARTKEIEAEQAEMIQAKQIAFQNFYQDQVEAKLQFFKDQMASAQDGYNELNATLTGLSRKAQAIQDEISDNINALGGVIGWWCHENNVPDSVMDQSYFIGMALQAVIQLAGKYDQVQVFGGVMGIGAQTQTFWSGQLAYFISAQNIIDANSDAYPGLSNATLAPGMVLAIPPIPQLTTPAQYTVQAGDTLESISDSFGNVVVEVGSAELAAETTQLMIDHQTAVDDYNMQSPGLIAQMQKISDWMTQIKQAFQVTQDLLNSTAYAQSLQPIFAATPQGQMLQADIDAVVNPLRQISLEVQTNQKTLQGILDDLEIQVLADNGLNIGDLPSLPYEKKKALWVGVCDHLAGPGQRLDELNGYITQISDRIHAGTPEDGDAENIQVAKVALMNIIGAQVIQRKLQSDLNFMSALHDDANSDYQSAVQGAQVAAQTAAASGTGAGS